MLLRILVPGASVEREREMSNGRKRGRDVGEKRQEGIKRVPTDK
jgi:hypothetical protein